MMRKWGIEKDMFVALDFFKNTHISTSRKHFNNNTIHYANNKNIQRICRRQRHVTLQFGHGGCHQGLLVKKYFIT